MANFEERVPPQALEAEQSILGACLIDRDALDKVRATVKSDDFYAEKHARVFEAILRAADAGQADLITVQAELARVGLPKLGDLDALSHLINTVPTTANAEQYATLVATKAKLRRLQAAARAVIDESYEAEDTAVPLGNLQQAIDRLGRVAGKSSLKPVAGRIGTYGQRRYTNRHTPNADWIPSVSPELREKCPYLRREFTLLAMPPNNGKTTLAVAEADFLTKLGYQTAFFELEMGEEQIYDKFIALNAGLNAKEIRMGLLTELEWIIYEDHAQKLDQRQSLYLNSETAETMSNIRWQCLRLKAEHGLDMVIIDFLERTNEERVKDERYDQVLARIAALAQRIARECNCHVMVLAQVDTKVLARTNPLPGLEDLANSKTNLSAWPDNVITGLQPQKAKGDGRGKPPNIYGVPCQDKRWKNTLALYIAKSRFGETGEVIPVYAGLSTGHIGSLRKAWPWQIKCPMPGERLKDAKHHNPEDCPKGEELCAYNQVGKWDDEEDKRYAVAMASFRERALAATVATEPWF